MHITNSDILFRSFIVFCLLFNHILCTNYCSPIFCNNTKTHTMCKFKESSPSHNCFKYERLITTNKEKEYVLDKVNSRRNRVASGEIRSLAAAKNMQRIIWNSELEVSAQRWADQCVKSSIYHDSDTCRDLENMSVGQNIATIYGEAPGLTPSSLVDLWYMELLNMNASILHRYIPSSLAGIQHFDYFTQLVWATTSEVGCAGVKFEDTNESENKTIYRLVCNFAPSGNRFGESVYITGMPCSRCPHGGSCDSEYTFLCAHLSSSTKYSENISNFQNINAFHDKNNLSNIHNETKDEQNILIEPYTNIDNDTQFDFFSHLFGFTKQSLIETESTTKCKEVLAVDEFIELLKTRLSNDQILKDLLLSSTKLPTTEITFSDRTMADILDQIYSKKTTIITTNKITENNDINSTVLADLVEAVIFRHNNVYSMANNNEHHTTNPLNTDPVKMQAKFAEVSPNMKISGHYFFPEEEEKTENETDYYEGKDYLPVSEIVLEIEDLKNSRVTKNFLDEVLDSDMAEITTEINSLAPINGVYLFNTINSTTVSKLRKRALKTLRYNLKSKRGGFYIKYNILLKRIAADIRSLKLNERLYCAHNFVETLSSNIFRALSMIFIAYFNL